MKWSVQVTGRIVVDAFDKDGAKAVAQGLLAKYAPWMEANDNYNTQRVAEETDMELGILTPDVQPPA